MNNKGFTLTELLVVIAIIAVITLITVPSVYVVNKNSNTRLYNARKEMVLVASELYAQDHKELFNNNDLVFIKIKELISEEYIKPDLKKGASTCTNPSYNDGCLSDPRDKTILNEKEVMIIKRGKSYTSFWEGEYTGTGENELVDTICDKISRGEYSASSGASSCKCSDIDSGTIDACLITGNEENNYLSYNGTMWRVLGVYKVDGTKKIKMITDETILTP